MSTKAHKITLVQSWITEACTGNNVAQLKLTRYKDEKELRKLTIAQLDMLLAFCTAVHSFAFRGGTKCAREIEATRTSLGKAAS
jgi:hypothetical protein